MTRPRHIVYIRLSDPTRIARMRSILAIDQRVRGHRLASLSHTPARLAFRNHTDPHLELDHWPFWLLIALLQERSLKSPSQLGEELSDPHLPLASHLLGPANALRLQSLAISRFSGEVLARCQSDHSVLRMSRQTAVMERVDGRQLSEPAQTLLHPSCTCLKAPMTDGPSSNLHLDSQGSRHCLKHPRPPHSRICYTTSY